MRLLRGRQAAREIEEDSDRGTREKYVEGGSEEKATSVLGAGKRKTARVRKGGTVSGINSDYASLENFRTGKSKTITAESIFSLGLFERKTSNINPVFFRIF